MLVEIFEAHPSAETDAYVMRLKKENPGCTIRKINVLDRDAMKKHPDVVAVLREKGIEALPLVKTDGRMVAIDWRESDDGT
ncbi:MAG TPA: hypothetical protein VI979_04600 [archaeon]|nr:hypothetical protein [archaeon]